MAPQTVVAPAWFGVGILVLLAIGLALLALIVVVAVIVASGKSSAFRGPLKSAGLVVLLVFPALAVVGLVAAYFTRTAVSRITVHSDSGEVQEELSALRWKAQELRPRIVVQRQHVDSRDPSSEVVTQIVSDGGATASAPVSSDGGSSPLETSLVSLPASEKTVADEPTDSGKPDDQSQKTTEPAPTSADGRIGQTITDDVNAAIAGLNLKCPITGILRVRETLPREPEWATSGPLPGDSGVLVPISSQRFATLGEAEEQVTRLAVAYVRKFYDREYPLSGDWNVPVSVIEQHAVRSLVGEELDKDFGNGIQGKMYRAHLRLDLNSRLRKALNDSWHDQIVIQRLTMLGGGLGVVTVMLASAAGYFRLNELTDGRYRGRLKLAAAALIGAACVGVLAVG